MVRRGHQALAGAVEAVVLHAVEQVHCLQHEIIGGHVVRVLAQREAQLLVAHLWRDGARHAHRDTILQREQIVRGSVEALCPQDATRFGIT